MTKSNNKITNTSQYDQANQNICIHYNTTIGCKILYKRNVLQLCPHMKDKETYSARNYLHIFSHCSMRCINGIGSKTSAKSLHQLPQNKHTSTHDLCGPYNKLQSVDRKQFPILKEAHHQHSQQMSMAL